MSWVKSCPVIEKQCSHIYTELDRHPWCRCIWKANNHIFVKKENDARQKHLKEYASKS